MKTQKNFTENEEISSNSSLDYLKKTRMRLKIFFTMELVPLRVEY